jgi:hypothetical protein
MFAYCCNNPVRFVDPTGNESIRWDVPLYQQGNYGLCWAACQFMVLDYYSGKRTFSIENAKQLSIEISGVDEASAIPLNIKLIPTFTSKLTPEKLYKKLEKGPVYAYYKGTNRSHVVVVTGMDLDNNIVYTNNPQYGEEGKQSFTEFMNGVYYPPGSSSSYSLVAIFQATDHVNPFVKFAATLWFHFLYI